MMTIVRRKEDGAVGELFPDAWLPSKKGTTVLFMTNHPNDDDWSVGDVYRGYDLNILHSGRYSHAWNYMNGALEQIFDYLEMENE